MLIIVLSCRQKKATKLAKQPNMFCTFHSFTGSFVHSFIHFIYKFYISVYNIREDNLFLLFNMTYLNDSFSATNGFSFSYSQHNRVSQKKTKNVDLFRKC